MAEAGLFFTLALGVLMLTSGAAKLASGDFARDVANYKLMPRSWVNPIATLIPWLEIALGTALVVLPDPSWPLVVAAVLMLAYASAVTINLVRDRLIPCGCHGSSRPISWWLVGEDLTWAALALMGSLEGVPSLSQALLFGSSDVSASDSMGLLVALVCVLLLMRTANLSRKVSDANGRVEHLINEGVR